MLSKSQLSLIKSLHLKKFRNQHQLFLVEGEKSIAEFLSSGFELSQLFYVKELTSKMTNFPHKRKHVPISSADFNKISSQKNPSGTLAVFSIPPQIGLQNLTLENKFTLVLDGVQDPGNLGTIIRIADWFAIDTILCSEDTVSCFNPKVVQATMGSLARIKVYYTDLKTWLPKFKHIKSYAAELNGTSLYAANLGKANSSGTAEGLIILGNEGHGIRPEISEFVEESITIPKYGDAESLNVAIACALICAEIKRNSEQS